MARWDLEKWLAQNRTSEHQIADCVLVLTDNQYFVIAMPWCIPNHNMVTPRVPVQKWAPSMTYFWLLYFCFPSMKLFCEKYLMPVIPYKAVLIHVVEVMEESPEVFAVEVPLARRRQQHPPPALLLTASFKLKFTLWDCFVTSLPAPVP